MVYHVRITFVQYNLCFLSSSSLPWPHSPENLEHHIFLDHWWRKITESYGWVTDCMIFIALGTIPSGMWNRKSPMDAFLNFYILFPPGTQIAPARKVSNRHHRSIPLLSEVDWSWHGKQHSLTVQRDRNSTFMYLVLIECML